MLLFNAKTICKAAEFSMLFQPSGEVLPCHYNRGYILGKYPDNSIGEIWNGKKRAELIKSIRKNFYHLGCFQCKTDSENGLSHSVGKNKYLYVKTNHKNFPSLMEFQLDNICNLECIMCSGEYSSKIRQNIEKGEKYISPYDDRFVEQLEPFIPFLEQVVFTGGEPFLFPIYYKIWDLIGKIKPELQIYVSTNGTVLNDKVRQYLSKLNFNFTISIDSINEETYCKIRRNAKLDVTLNNIDYFIKYSNDRNASLNIKCLVLPQNFKDIPDLIEYFNKKQINVLPKLVYLPLYTSMSSLTNSDLNEVIEVLSSTSLSSDSPITVQNKNRFFEVIRQIELITMKNTFDSNELMSLNIEELKQMLEFHILDGFKKIDNSALKEFSYYQNLLNILYASIKNEESQLKTALVNFLKLSPEFIINEFHRDNTEKLIARFRQTKISDK